jgi:hypothetical protein
MSEKDSKCFFCGSGCEVYPAPLMHNVKDYRCPCCGPYLLNDTIVSMYAQLLTDVNKFKVACILNERRLNGLSGIALSNKTDANAIVYTYPQVSFEDVVRAFPEKPGDFIDRILLNLSRLPQRPFEVIRLDMAVIGNRLHFFTESKQECCALLRELSDQGLVRFDSVADALQFDTFYLTQKFWERIEHLRSRLIDIKRDADHLASASDHFEQETTVGAEMVYDLFIAHASEDKDSVARPLYEALKTEGFTIWFDEVTLELGDSLRRKIDAGLARCRFGIVILSHAFLAKEWPQRELDGLLARETTTGEKALLPVWHGIDAKTIAAYSPTLADRVAARSDEGIAVIVQKILRVLRQ